MLSFSELIGQLVGQCCGGTRVCQAIRGPRHHFNLSKPRYGLFHALLSEGELTVHTRPGNIKSELQRNMTKLQHFFVVGSRTLVYIQNCPDMVNQDTLLLYPTPMGALTQLYAGTMPEALNYNGEARPFEIGDSIL